MKGWTIAILSILGFLVLAFIGLYIAAECQDMTMFEMFRSWFETTAENPPTEDTVETTALFINSLRI